MTATVHLTPESVAWLDGRPLTLRASPRHGCCGGTVAVPIAEPGAPDPPDGFAQVAQDGVTVYIDDRLDPSAWRVGLDRLFGLARLYAEPGG